MATTIKGLLPDGTAPSALLAQIREEVSGAGYPPGTVPIFVAQSVAQAWERDNPGRVALWLDGSGTPQPPDPTGPDPDPGGGLAPLPPGAVIITSDSFTSPSNTPASRQSDALLGGTPLAATLTVEDAFKVAGGTLQAVKTGRYLHDVGAPSRTGLYIAARITKEATYGDLMLRAFTGMSGGNFVDVICNGGSKIAAIRDGSWTQTNVKTTWAMGDTIGLLAKNRTAQLWKNGQRIGETAISEASFTGGPYAGVIAGTPVGWELDDLIIAEV